MIDWFKTLLGLHTQGRVKNAEAARMLALREERDRAVNANSFESVCIVNRSRATRRVTRSEAGLKPIRRVAR